MHDFVQMNSECLKATAAAARVRLPSTATCSVGGGRRPAPRRTHGNDEPVTVRTANPLGTSAPILHSSSSEAAPLSSQSLPGYMWLPSLSSSSHLQKDTEPVPGFAHCASRNPLPLRSVAITGSIRLRYLNLCPSTVGNLFIWRTDACVTT